MKKILAFVTVLTLILTFCLSGCSLGTPDRESELKDALDESIADLSDTFSDSGTSFTMVEEYIQSWARNNDIDVTAKADHYMVLSNHATAEGKKGESLSMVCTVDPDDMSTSTHSLGVGMTALLGPEEHADVSLIILESTDSSYSGARSIDTKYLQVDHLIELDKTTKNSLTIGGAYAFDATITNKVSYQAPSYANAYEITFTVSNYNDAFDFGNKYPNAINVIGDYLASGKSGAKLFQLASFSCKVSDCFTPYSATVVIVVDDNSVESMKSKFENSYNNIKDKCDKLGANFVYTMNETTLPDRVMTDTSATSIINLIYTIDSGIFYQGEETGSIISADDIDNINTSGGKLTLKINARSKTKKNLTELDTALKTTAGLSDANYKISESYITWNSDEDLADYFKTVLNISDDEDLYTVKTSNLNVLSNKNEDLNCIQYGIGDDGEEVAMLNCIHYMSHLIGDDSDATATTLSETSESTE